MNDIDPRINDSAIKLYDGEANDEFPVLKAFQQYIDSEHAKARKRMMTVCVFFGFILTVVMGVFVVLLVAASSRNQRLNDRLVEYAMKDRERTPVVVQSKRNDSDVLAALTSKLESLTAAVTKTATVTKDRDRVEASETAKNADEIKKQTAESLEIERLKALLAVEKEKTSIEREKRRQQELEAYRRSHYPEFYEKKQRADESVQKPAPKEDEADREIEELLKDLKAMDLDDEEDENQESVQRSSSRKVAENDGQLKTQPPVTDSGELVPGVKDGAGNTWEIPLE